MSRGAPAGWYADPGEPGQLRWWDGAAWAPSTVAPSGGGRPEAAGTSAGSTRAPRTATVEAIPAAERIAAPRVRTGTVWVWLAIVSSIFPFCSPLVVDAVTGARLIGFFVLPAHFDPGPAGWVVAGLLLLTAVNGLALAASVLFAWLDARALRGRGIERPFGWGWAVLVFAATLAVYIAGRTVIVRRVTGRGSAPLWGWLVALIAGLAALALWLGVFVDALWALVVAA